LQEATELGIGAMDGHVETAPELGVVTAIAVEETMGGGERSAERRTQDAG